MFLRMMTSSSAETSRTGENTGRNPPSYNSLNCFVVNHQSLGNANKPYRGPGLPRGNSRASTGNLVAIGGSEFGKQTSYTECNNALPLARSSSATNGLPQPEWLVKNANNLATPELATVPSNSVLKKPNTPSNQRIKREKDNELPLSPFWQGPGSKSAPNSRPSTPVPTLISNASENSDDKSSKNEQERKVNNESRQNGGAQLASKDAGIQTGKLTQSRQNSEAGYSGVPVFVMMPLDTVTADGIFRHANTRWFHQALDALAQSGVHGIAVDVWWGAVERQPEEYDWTGYRQLFEVARSKRLKVQAVLSFHACGGNVGDSAQIPLPQWVLEAGEIDPALFFKDRPRPSRDGLLNREYISFWADEAPRILFGRSPLECYTDYMREFRNAFKDDLGDLIEEIIIGSGPCGELRYASYPEINGWRFPGVGEFQCYDRRALASLSECAQRVGHPEWGQTGPHDSGEYNSTPDETGFFRGWEGSWDSPYGRFFLNWYSKSLLEHGERLLRAAHSVFNFRVSKSKQASLNQQKVQESKKAMNGQNKPRNLPTSPISRPSKSCEDKVDRETLLRQANSEYNYGSEQNLSALSMTPTSSTSSFLYQSHTNSFASMDEGVPVPPSTQSPIDKSDQPRLRRAGQRFDGRSISLAELETVERPSATTFSRSEDGERRKRVNDGPSGPPVGITLKVAGVHWWYRTNAHAAELTAGYFNAGNRNGYRDIIQLCAKYNATFTLTCVEMCDSQHPPETLCGPEGLLRQVKEDAADLGVEVGGENALPCFFPMHIDDAGLDRIVYNTQAWVSPLQREAAREEAFNPRSELASVPPLPDPKSLGFHGDPRSGKSGKLLASHLPRMRGLTFLRLTQEMMTPKYQGAWLRFMQRMQNIGNKPALC